MRVHSLSTCAAGCACSGEKAWFLEQWGGSTSCPWLCWERSSCLLPCICELQCFDIAWMAYAAVCQRGNTSLPYAAVLLQTLFKGLDCDLPYTHTCWCWWELLVTQACPDKVHLRSLGLTAEETIRQHSCLTEILRFMCLAQHALTLICCWNIYGKEQPSDWGT